MVDAAGEGVQIRPHCSVAVARRRSRSAVLEPAVAPAGTDGRLFVEGVAQLHVATVGAAQLRAGRDGSCAFTSREQQGGAQTLADVSGHDDREVGEVTADAGRAADRASRLTGARRVRRALPQTASPNHVLVLPSLLVVGKLRLNARDLRDDKHARPRDRAPTGARAGGGAVPGTCVFVVTKIPRVEAEFTYNQKAGKNKYMIWAGGLWQSTSNAASAGQTASSVGGTAGVRGDFADLSVIVTGYIGKGLGTTLLFSGGERAGTVATSTELRSSDGGYVQLGYTLNKKTTIGASWGYSRLKNSGAAAPAGDGNTAVRTNLYSFTGGVYHQWTKSLKLVFEGTQEGTTNPGRAKQIDLSGGFMLFF